jgi:hypothetical protein
MRKHYKLISGIACIVLCISIFCFGVYAASTSLVKLNSTVSFTPSTAKLTIFGGISGCKETEPSSYYGTNYGDKSLHKNVSEKDDLATFSTWAYGDATFDDDYYETELITHPDPIYFMLQITNHVERDVAITVDITSDYSQFNYLVYCSYELAKNSEINTLNMYDISNKSNPTQATTDMLASKAHKPYNNQNAISYSSGVEVDFTSLDTTLSTLLIVFRLEINDHRADLEKNAIFNFTVSIV